MSTFRACANWTGAPAARDKGKPLRREPAAARNVRGLDVAALPFWTDSVLFNGGPSD